MVNSWLKRKLPVSEYKVPMTQGTRCKMSCCSVLSLLPFYFSEGPCQLPHCMVLCLPTLIFVSTRSKVVVCNDRGFSAWRLSLQLPGKQQKVLKLPFLRAVAAGGWKFASICGGKFQAEVWSYLKVGMMFLACCCELFQKLSFQICQMWKLGEKF